MKKIQLALQYVALMNVINYGKELTREQMSNPNFMKHLQIVASRYNGIELENLITDCRRRIAAHC